MVELFYAADTGEPTTGLLLRVHFDSSVMTFDGLSGVVSDRFSAVQDIQDGPCRGEDNPVCPGLDGDPDTDRYVNILWFAEDGDWLPQNGNPTPLLTAHFVAAGNLEDTTIGFTGLAAAGFVLEAASIDVTTASGDVNGDNAVNATDIDLLAAAIRDGSNNSRFDLTGDGAINDTDRLFLIEEILGTSSGDSNLDGRFNQLDLVLVLVAGRYRTRQTATWAEGDWNGDGVFDPQDIVAALQAGNYSPG